jgi:hypothetical protein
VKTVMQFLDEGISPIVYHATQTSSAYQILKTNKFKLTSPIGSDKMVKGKKSQMFYLSTTRSKHGRYHQMNLAGAILELDGRKLANNYKGQPIDYWGPEFRKVDPTGFESEDRIFSPKPEIPNASKYIKSIHVLLPVTQYRPPKGDGTNFFDKPAVPKGTVEGDLSDREKRNVQLLWVEAKKRKVPIYFYDTHADWTAQRKPMDLKVAQLALKKGPQPFPPVGPQYGRADRQSQLHTWVELIMKPITAKLSTSPFGGAKRQLDILFSQFDAMSQFDADFSNSKKHKDSATIIQFMRKNGLHEFKDLIEWLREKWKSKY